MIKNHSILYRAPFMVTGVGTVIEDGAVIVSDNIIREVGTYKQLHEMDSKVIDCEGQIIAPALINCHAHLELSWMSNHQVADHTFEPGDITGWIRGLLKKRDHYSPSDDEITTAARIALDVLHKNGTIAVADIGNRQESIDIGIGHRTTVLFHLEMMGLTQTAALQQLDRVKNIDFSATGHGPYSSHPELIQGLKKRAKKRNDIFPLHIAETSDEVEFLQTGKGRFYDFLNERLKHIGEYEGNDLFDFFTAPECGAVQYIDRLGVLDENTLCVHAVHITEEEVDLIASAGAKVCLCPRSNSYIGVGTAPVDMFIKKGILPGLGTDSLVSNSTLNIFSEMAALAEDHPHIDSNDIFSMATLGGALSINKANVLGSIEKGKQAALLGIECEDISAQDVVPFLVHTGEDLNVNWLENCDG